MEDGWRVSRADRVLTGLYAIAGASSLIVTISGSVAWGYWQHALDRCGEINCGCILSGMWTYNVFYGGKILTCRYFAFVPLPVVIWSIVMFVYHTCFPSKEKPLIVDVRLRGRVLIRESSKRSEEPTVKRRRLYIPLFVSLLSFLALFSSSVILSYGYDVTCREYRKAVINQLQATGDQAALVFNRLSCSSIFDFMDYLQPDPPLLPIQYRRESWKINTGAALGISLFADWTATILYAIITYMNLALCIKGNMFYIK